MKGSRLTVGRSNAIIRSKRPFLRRSLNHMHGELLTSTTEMTDFWTRHQAFCLRGSGELSIGVITTMPGKTATSLARL